MRTHCKLEEKILRVEGLVGEITRFISEAGIRTYPIAAFSTAVAIVGALKAQRWRTVCGNYTNVYCLTLGNTSIGKTHAKKCGKMILKAAGYDWLCMGKMQNEAGVIRAIKDRGGRAIILWDEFSQRFQRFTSPSSSLNSHDYMEVILDLWSHAGEAYIGRELSNRNGEHETRVIENPCFVMSAYSTPQAFHDALNEQDAENGFLPRLMVFEVHSDNTSPRPFIVEREELIVPSLLVEYIDLVVGSADADIPNSLAHHGESTSFSEEAVEHLKRLHDFCTEQASLTDWPMREFLFGKTQEKARKLALILSDCKKVIDGRTAKAACDIVMHIDSEMVTLAENQLFSGQLQKNVDEVERVVKRLSAKSPSGWVKESLVRKGLRKKSMKQRRDKDQAILEAVDQEVVIRKDDTVRANGRPYKLYSLPNKNGRQ